MPNDAGPAPRHEFPALNAGSEVVGVTLLGALAAGCREHLPDGGLVMTTHLEA